MRGKPIVWRNKTVGVIIGDAYTSRRKRSIHYYRKYNGYGVQLAVVERLSHEGIRYIVIIEEDTNTQYRTSVGTMLAHGIPIDDGHGEQLILPIRYWECIMPGQVVLF